LGPLITLEEAGEYLRVETAVVERAVREGQLLAYRVGEQFRTTWDAVEAYLQANATVPDNAPTRIVNAAHSNAYRTGLASTRSKYWRIGELLSAQEGPYITYSFATLEREIGRELPPSASHHRAWWSNTSTSHPHAQSWLSRGWRVASVSLADKEVTFERS